ncbi:MAG: DUF1501 domain-containing protein [Phycisphaerales bacterium]|nr:DUF1501 domain-containing protein [Phycisphaerales bacterium]
MADPNLPFSRRIFLQQGVTLASLVSTIPWFLQHSALGVLSQQSTRTGSTPGVPEDRVLVVVQLGGGNDGLNTIVPYGDDAYYRARPTLAIASPERAGSSPVLIADAGAGLGLHPNLGGLKALLDDGRLSIVQGVGYPNPNRSHFASMDIWQTARTDAKGAGWIGRYVDCTCSGTPDPEGVISIGRTAPLALVGERSTPVSFENAQLFRWMGADVDPALEPTYEQMTRAGEIDGVAPGSQQAFLMRTALDAQLSSDRIRDALRGSPLVRYPTTTLARQMQAIGAMIRAGMRTRVYYASIGGFDTHAGQANAHGQRLREVGDALKAFQDDLVAQGNDTRVLTMVFSEFGRRVRQNASGGTDHGTAAPMFLIGPMVKAGVVGTHPSLTDLDSGDLKFTTDFRSVYASVLDDWMRAPAGKVLGGSYPKAKVLRS